jgi:hypothetical protein
LLTTHEVDKDQRERIESEWNGPLTTVERDLPREDTWAPTWWQGDEEATRSAMAAAMMLDMGRGR